MRYVCIRGNYDHEVQHPQVISGIFTLLLLGGLGYWWLTKGSGGDDSDDLPPPPRKQPRGGSADDPLSEAQRIMDKYK
jgi:hypothetical protein